MLNKLLPGELLRKEDPPYVYQEYPKWVTLADGSQIIVHNADEETAVIGPEEKQEPKRRGRPPKNPEAN